MTTAVRTHEELARDAAAVCDAFGPGARLAPRARVRRPAARARRTAVPAALPRQRHDGAVHVAASPAVKVQSTEAAQGSVT